MRFAKNPVIQFLVAGVLVLVVVVIGSARLSSAAADDEALIDAQATTEVLATSVAQPAIPRGLAAGSPGAVDRFDRTALARLLVGDVRRIKIWTPRGDIVYSDETRLIGERYPLGPKEQKVLHGGGTDAELSDLEEPENRFEPKGHRLFEVYTRMTDPEGKPLLFEAYFSAADIDRRRKQVYDAFAPIALGGLLVLVVVTTPLLWALTRRLEHSARDRTRLLERAADASESERRRIARDLHDGVVQDLAGTAFALSATVRDPGVDPGVSSRLEPMATSLRTSLRSLRSLLVEIYPPELGADGLEAALEDLVAPAAAVGVTARVEVYDVGHASQEAVRLVWRVAQEAVRNAIRHASAQHLTVQVRGLGDRLTLDVTDDGAGFESPSTGNGLGLRSLRDLIAEAGGTLDVRSAVGGGTTVHLEVR